MPTTTISPPLSPDPQVLQATCRTLLRFTARSYASRPHKSPPAVIQTRIRTQSSTTPKATPIAVTLSQHLPQSFFARPAEEVAPELVGCLLVKRQAGGELLWDVKSGSKSAVEVGDGARYRMAFWAL